jgi:hypothetical protein
MKTNILNIRGEEVARELDFSNLTEEVLTSREKEVISHGKTLFENISSKKSIFLELPFINEEDFLKELANQFSEFRIKPKKEGKDVGGIVEDKNQNEVYVKITKISLLEQCLYIAFYLYGIGAKIDFAKSSDPKKTVVISNGLLNSKKDINKRRLIYQTNDHNSRKMVNEASNVIAYLFRVRDIGSSADGQNNSMLLFHEDKEDNRLKIVDFLKPHLETLKTIDPKKYISSFKDIIKIKLGLNGKPLSGSERKVGKSNALILQVLEYSFKEGIRKFFEREGVILSNAELEKLNAFKINSTEIDLLNKRLKSIKEDFYSKVYAYKNELIKNPSMWDFFKNNKLFNTFFASDNKPIDLGEALHYAKQEPFNEEEINSIKEMVGIGNNILFERYTVEKELEEKIESIYKEIQDLIPNHALSIETMAELYLIAQYKDKILEPNIIKPLKEIEVLETIFTK